MPERRKKKGTLADRALTDTLVGRMPNYDRREQWYENPKLYALAKKVTLEAGLPYTDPRSGKTTQPRKVKKP